MQWETPVVSKTYKLLFFEWQEPMNVQAQQNDSRTHVTGPLIRTTRQRLDISAIKITTSDQSSYLLHFVYKSKYQTDSGAYFDLFG